MVEAIVGTPLVVVQNNLVTRLTEPVAKAVHELGLTLYDLSSGDNPGRPGLPSGEWNPILVIGSILFCEQWNSHLPNKDHWLFYNDSNFDAAIWALELEEHFFNADGYSSTIREYLEGPEIAHHIRPRSEMKLVGDKLKTESSSGQESIAGMVITPRDLAVRNIDPDTLIWVSPLKEIAAEIRIWMIGGKVATASLYRLEGKFVFTSEGPLVDNACAKALELHDVWYPEYHYVVDIALGQDGVYRVLEYNPIHSSGWYAADPKDVINAFIHAEKKDPSDG